MEKETDESFEIDSGSDLQHKESYLKLRKEFISVLCFIPIMVVSMLMMTDLFQMNAADNG